MAWRDARFSESALLVFSVIDQCQPGPHGLLRDEDVLALAQVVSENQLMNALDAIDHDEGQSAVRVMSLNVAVIRLILPNGRHLYQVSYLSVGLLKLRRS